MPSSVSLLRRAALGSALSLVLSACGGGSASPPPAPPAPPSLTLALSSAKGAVGKPVTVTWSAAAATACSGTGQMSGNQPVSGSTVVTPAAGGQFSYGLTCTGAGGTTSQAATLVVPMPVFATSYENKNAIGVEDTAFPNLYDPSMSALLAARRSDEVGFNERSLSLADFAQDGSYTLFATMTRFNNLYPKDNTLNWPDSPSEAFFMHKGADGKWVDDTAKFLPNPEDRKLCITTTYSIVADFNNDGKPDLYIPCTDVDFQVNGTWDDASEQHMLLSQPDGTYKHTILPIGRIYGHQATAADIDGDGKVDIVTVDPAHYRTPFVLWGNGDGTFRQDLTRMPADMASKWIYGAILIPIEGKLRLVVSGNSPGSTPQDNSWNYGTAILSYRNGAFQYDNDLTPTLPMTHAGYKFSLATDHLYRGGYLYSIHVSNDYTEQGLTKTNVATGETQLIFSTAAVDWTTSLPQLHMTSDGYITLFGIACNQNDDTAKLKCAYRIKS